tara:strand:+ start:473 stop:688 length:216 start_codon:yes stop_codon:yes gene_type:complete
MPRFKIVDDKRIQLTEAEEAARNEEEKQAAIDKQARSDAETTDANKKASGKQKLKDLGLDDAEIKALMGVE